MTRRQRKRQQAKWKADARIPHARASAASKTACKRRGSIALRTIVQLGDEPPTEFRIFAAGDNTSTKGNAVFDEAAAKAVMAAYEAHGAELCVDYNHCALDDKPMDPATAGKAAGWFRLEVRGGELWAVDVRWTAAAAEMIRAREWRYISPAFWYDGDNRVTELLNVALTNTPATDNPTPLMAASALTAHAVRNAESSGAKFIFLALGKALEPHVMRAISRKEAA